VKRACIGSAIFLGGLLFSLSAPALETVASAEPLAAAPPVAPSAKGKVVPPATADAGSSCAEGMAEVVGDYCPSLEQRCVRWLDPKSKSPRRCAEFAKSGACRTKTVRKHFCIDRFEYPNKQGEKPAVMKTWYEARDACKADGKRLCGDSEWTLACEGQQRLPYPYGLERSADACNIDKPHPAVNERALASRRTRDAEAARLWQGESSGARASCVSSYGVFDMTGNVDEWVVNERGVPFQSALKGGYWGPVRDRCRPTTTAHGEDFSFYQIGFRCCSDAS
jgi:formylglycine-generating enzyme